MENIVAATSESTPIVASPSVARDSHGACMVIVSSRAISEQEMDYILSRYTGKYRRILELMLEGKQTKEIADAVGKTTKRIRQLKNGNKQRGQEMVGLLQTVSEILAGMPVG
ncbi:MAG: hypothetical protein ACYDB0_00620 [Acidithiobacillus sp.]